MEEELARRVEFALRWSRDRIVVVLGLDIRRGNEPWRPLVLHPIAEKDGEVILDLGAQEDGRIAIKFAVGALDEVPQMAAFVIEGGTRVTQVAPAKPGEFKRLEPGQHWLETVRYDVGSPRA